MASRAAEFAAIPVDVVVVGSGSPAAARAFAKERAVPFRLLTDPSLGSFQAAGLKRGISHVFARGMLSNALRAWGEGHRQGATQGDPWQQGGVVIVRAGGRVAWAYISDIAGDHADVDVIVAAARGA